VASIIKVGEKWRALVRRKGQPSYCKTFKVKAQAEAWARQIEADIDRGATPRASAVVGKTLLVSDLIDEYRKLRERSRPILDTSNEHYELKRLSKHLGEKDALHLSSDDLVGYCALRAEDGAGPYTINMEMSKLGTAMRYAAMALKVRIPDAVKEARPLLSHLKLVGGGGKRERRPTEDELHHLLQALEEGFGKVYADAVRFAVGTAMRRGEIARIEWGDLDIEKKMVLVRDRKDPRQKVGNDQWVPLLGGMWDLVQSQVKHDDDEPRIFPIHPQTLSKYFKAACDQLGIADLHFHDLRHEGTSQLFEQGYQVQQVALVTGHKSWAHLKRYTNLRPEDLHKGPSRG
jgi:integrase